MKTTSQIGHFIEIANMQETYEDKGIVFLKLLRDD